MLLGLITPTSGTATVLGARPGEPASVRHIGALVEGPGFYPYLSGRDNLRVMARYQRADDSAVDAALARVDLAARGGDAFKSYSLGMKQRLGVAAALLGDPYLLVLDEPTNGLDPGGMADMRRLIVDLAAQGQTVMLSSHLLAEVQEICDRVGVINSGRLLAEATVADLRGATTLVVRGTPVDRVLAVAMGVAGDDAVSLEGDGLVRIAAGAECAPEVSRALIAEDVELYEIRPEERSLEEVFFEITGAAGLATNSRSGNNDVLEVSR
jgi:ABC-2 type transport system ATP-binding protein